MRRWQRVLVCLLLVCCILVNLSPLRADATAAGLAGTITAVSTVNVPAGLAIGAAAIALGVMAGTNDDFQNLVTTAASSGFEWVKDGTVELLRTVDALGNQAFYVAGAFLEDLRVWLFDEKNVDSLRDLPLGAGSQYLSALETALSKHPSYGQFAMWCSSGVYYFASSMYDFVIADNTIKSKYSSSFYVYDSVHGAAGLERSSFDLAGATVFVYDKPISSETLVPALDLNLGVIPLTPVDGSSALSWSPEYQANRLKVIEGGNDPDPDSDPPNDGKWFWPLALTATTAVLFAMSQADEWSGETPREFDDYSTNTEFEILDRPEIDGYQGIELSPATNPDVNPDTGEGADPTEPGEPTEPSEDESTGSDSETNWFEKIWKSIVELPNSFKTWFEDLKKGIEELPSKFTQWATDTISAIQNLPQAFANLFSDVVAAIQSVPQTIKDFFTPKSPDNHDKFALADLSKFFPFCIPFDLYDFFTLLNADPVAPVLSWEIRDLAGQTYSLDVDLSQWDSVALLFRRLQLFLFITGLAAASRKFIKW